MIIPTQEWFRANDHWGFAMDQRQTGYQDELHSQKTGNEVQNRRLYLLGLSPHGEGSVPRILSHFRFRYREIRSSVIPWSGFTLLVCNIIAKYFSAKYWTQ